MANKCCIVQTVNGGFRTIPSGGGGGGGGETTKIQRTPGDPGQPSDSDVFTTVVFQETPFDQLDAADLVSNPEQLVVQESGIYQLTAYVQLDSPDGLDPTNEQLRIVVNGTPVPDGVDAKSIDGGSTLLAVTTLQLFAGDIITVVVIQVNTGDLTRNIVQASLVLTSISV